MLLDVALVLDVIAKERSARVRSTYIVRLSAFDVSVGKGGEELDGIAAGYLLRRTRDTLAPCKFRP